VREFLEASSSYQFVYRLLQNKVIGALQADSLEKG
jgi:hypothetical protein